MKVKQVLSITVLLAAAMAAPAQGQIGIQGGLNFSSVSVTVDGADVSTDNRTRWNIGVFTSRGGLIGIQGGVYYSQKGFSTGVQDVDLDYVEIPVMLRVKFLMLRAYGGPNFAFKVDCDEEGTANLGGVAFNCSDTGTFEFGWKIGAGGKLLVFMLDLAYEWGTTDIWDVDNGSMKNRVFQIQAGLGI